MGKRILKIILIALSYVLVVALTVFATMALGHNKTAQIQDLIHAFYVDEEGLDYNKLEDAAASAMVDALPDGWSYYISAEEYADYENSQANVFVGIGVTIQQNENGQTQIVSVNPGGGAQEAGVRIGDILVSVDGTDVTKMTTTEISNLVRGEEGTTVDLGLLREGTQVNVTAQRRTVQVQIVTAELLEEKIGYVRISNFRERSAEETIAAIDSLVEQGAEKLIFDVRGNGGGYKDEMVKVLNYLLPEGDLFRSVDYSGNEEVDKSDEKCLKLPMAVLMDGNSYSAAEFFAAALEEYEWAITVGEPTVGKGHFQITYRLPDGSAVALSTGRYSTPKGVNLSEVGGLKPNVPAELNAEGKAKLYSGILPCEEDPQLQAAIAALKS